MDYLYQELEPSSVERFEAHLRACPGCTELISGFEQTRSAFQELPEEDPPAAVSAFLLREAAAAVAPEQEGFWEKLRQGIRAMAMHPAMASAAAMVLVLGVSFYIYKAGPAPGEREMIDVPLVEEEHSIDQDRTAALGMRNDAPETATEKKGFAGKDQAEPALAAAQPPAGASAHGQEVADESLENEKPAEPSRMQAQAPAPMEAGYKELAGLNNKVGTRGAGGTGLPASSPRSARLRDEAPATSGPAPSADSLADGKGRAFRTSARDSLLRKVATATPAADPSPAPPPAKPKAMPKPSANRPQLIKRNEKASLGYGDYEDDALSGESNAEVTGGAGEETRTVAKAAPMKKPAPARRARSADKSGKKDSLDDLNYWQRGGSREMEPVAKQVAIAERKAEQKEADQDDSRQDQVAASVRKKQAAPASAPAPVSSQAKSPAPEAQQQLSPPERARLALLRGLAATSCYTAYSYFDQAIALRPAHSSDAKMMKRVRECAAILSRQGADEGPLLIAQKKYPRLASMLNPEIQRVQARRRIASKEAAEQRKAAKKTKAKAKKVRPSDKAATSY